VLFAAGIEQSSGSPMVSTCTHWSSGHFALASARLICRVIPAALAG